MPKRWIAAFAVVAALAGNVLLSSPARAETCVPLPPTSGATIEAAGQEVRVPATSGVAVCVEPGGLPGAPRVDQGPTSTDIILVGGGSGTAGYVAIRYTLDGVPAEHRVPIPGTGPGSDVCAASVGTATRADCLVKVTLDDDPIPTLPPTPTVPPVSPPPTPTVPPVSPPPTPTVPPVSPPPTPTPDPYCVLDGVCVPYGGSVLYPLVDTVNQYLDAWSWWLQNFENDDDVCIDEPPPGLPRPSSSSSSNVICDRIPW